MEKRQEMVTIKKITKFIRRQQIKVQTPKHTPKQTKSNFTQSL